ncbi:MAG: ribonuclease P protein component [Patescibacteria group bacterium]|jgi:ribonuclease P protein component
MLSAKHRIVTDRDWHNLHRRGQTYHEADAVLKVLPRHTPDTRFGFSIGLKVSKKSTQRNLLKRRLRVIAAKLLPRIKPGYDIAIIAKPPLKGLTFEELTDHITDLIARTKLFK